MKRVAGAGAALFSIGMVTGLWSAVALTEQVKVALPHLALAAHLNGLFGGLWLIAFAWTLPFLHYGEAGKRRLAVATLIPAWGNWALMVVASALGVRGIQYTNDPTNNAVAAAIQLLVVLPSLGATIAWAYGFRARRQR